MLMETVIFLFATSYLQETPIMAAIPLHHAPEGGERESTRVEAFSDGVIAIAITLLALDLRVPHLEEGASAAELLNQLAALMPNYIAFLTSFATIGIMWLNHHNLFKLIQRVDQGFLVINGILLLGMSFVSFPTAMFAEYMLQPGGTVAAVIYGGTFTVIALVYTLLFRYAAARGLLHPDTNPALVRMINRQYLKGPAVYFSAAIIGLFSPIGTYIITTLLAIYFMLPSRVTPVPQPEATGDANQK
jgi:uncharacterized membrane protein